MAFTTWDSGNGSGVSLDGTLLAATATANPGAIRAVAAQTTGKFYWEATFTTLSGSGVTNVGIGNGEVTIPGEGNTGTNTAYLTRGGVIGLNGGSTGKSLGTITAGTTVGIAVDVTNKLVWFRIAPSGNWNGNATYDPASGTGGVDFSSIFPAAPPYAMYPIAGFNAVNDKITANFGASAFSGAVPSGFISGWTANTVANFLLATQMGAEVAIVGTPNLVVTQIGAEVAYSLIPDLVVTRMGAEVAFDQSSLMPIGGSGGAKVFVVT